MQPHQRNPSSISALNLSLKTIYDVESQYNIRDGHGETKNINSEELIIPAPPQPQNIENEETLKVEYANHSEQTIDFHILRSREL